MARRKHQVKAIMVIDSPSLAISTHIQLPIIRELLLHPVTAWDKCAKYGASPVH